MISKIRRLEIAKCAEDLIKELQITSLPVNPIEIAKSRDITVNSWEPKISGVSGFLIQQGDAFGIGYSTFIKNQGFIHFTVGHELGHYFLPGHAEKLLIGNKPHFSHSGFVSDDNCEQEADLFSATLLMPGELFLKSIRKYGEGFNAIESLANLCMTSITATAIRYAEFSENPAAVLVTADGRVEFCCLSDALRNRQGLTWLKRGDFIPESSSTARFQKDFKNVTEGRKVKSHSMLDEWFEGAPCIEMKEDIIGLGHYEKTLTVLFTDKEIEEEDEPDSGEWKPRWER